MTLEEAINQLQDAKDGYREYLSDEAIDVAIKSMEQEPCEDAVSRKNIMKRLNNAKMFFDYEGADIVDIQRKKRSDRCYGDSSR